jgi:hypothetical protein
MYGLQNVGCRGQNGASGGNVEKKTATPNDICRLSEYPDLGSDIFSTHQHNRLRLSE